MDDLFRSQIFYQVIGKDACADENERKKKYDIWPDAEFLFEKSHILVILSPPTGETKNLSYLVFIVIS